MGFSRAGETAVSKLLPPDPALFGEIIPKAEPYCNTVYHGILLQNMSAAADENKMRSNKNHITLSMIPLFVSDGMHLENIMLYNRI